MFDAKAAEVAVDELSLDDEVNAGELVELLAAKLGVQQCHFTATQRQPTPFAGSQRQPTPTHAVFQVAVVLKETVYKNMKVLQTVPLLQVRGFRSEALHISARRLSPSQSWTSSHKCPPFSQVPFPPFPPRAATKEMTCRQTRQGCIISLSAATKEMPCRWVRQG